MVQVEIELIIIITLVLLMTGWAAWHRISLWRARKKYNPKEDKSKYGEEERRAKLEGRKPNPSAAAVFIPELAAIAERELLPSAIIDGNGKDDGAAVSDSNADKRPIGRLASRLKRRNKKE